MDLWKKWSDIHTQPDQCKRILSSRKSECTPVSVDVKELSGVFSGSHGIYHTTLESCQCGDFIRRRLPCKHMYRLAAECGIMDSGKIEFDTKKIKAPAPSPKERKEALIQVVKTLESYEDTVQNGIREVLGCSHKNEPYICDDMSVFQQPMADGLLEVTQEYEFVIRNHTQKSTLEKLEAANFVFPAELKKTKKARYEWCLDNADTVVPIAYPEVTLLRPAGLLEIAKKKVYTYLLRKFTNDSYFDGVTMREYPHGAEFVASISPGEISGKYEFPDDDVTVLLNQYGANRCKDWTE